jgi:hypothetical protein
VIPCPRNHTTSSVNTCFTAVVLPWFHRQRRPLTPDDKRSRAALLVLAEEPHHLRIHGQIAKGVLALRMEKPRGLDSAPSAPSGMSTTPASRSPCGEDPPQPPAERLCKLPGCDLETTLTASVNRYLVAAVHRVVRAAPLCHRVFLVLEQIKTSKGQG